WFRLLGTLYGPSTPDPARPSPDHAWPPCDAMPDGGPEPLTHRPPPAPRDWGLRAPHDHAWPPRDALLAGVPGPLPRRPPPLPAMVAMAPSVGVSRCRARHFLAPVTELTRGTRALIAGQFATRIRVASGDELGQLARDFNTLAHTLAHNEQARRHMTADIAH